MTSGMRSSWLHLRPWRNHIAVRIGFDDNRFPRTQETGARVALRVQRNHAQSVPRKAAGPVPEFPAHMEQSINHYLKSEAVEGTSPPERGQKQDKS